MAIPVESLLTDPYVTVPEFRAAPTWLDSDDLVPGGIATAQDAELRNVLLRASSWADNVVNQRLGAHARTEQRRARIDRRGRLSLHADDNPVRQVTALAYGPTPAALAPLADLAGAWVEDGRQILVHLGAAGTGGVRLEFGSAAAGGEVYVRLTYIAGHTATTLAAAAVQAATTVTVTDPTGIYPGDVLRIWDPGAEEAVTVAAGYVPGEASVPLTSALTHAHAAGAGLSGLPATVKQAIILRACAELLREDTRTADGGFGAEIQPTAQAAAGDRAGGLVTQAHRLLMSFRRVR